MIDDPQLAPEYAYITEAYNDPCTKETYKSQPRPPHGWMLRRCPIHESADLPPWILQAPLQCAIHWSVDYYPYPGPLSMQSRKWVEAMRICEHLWQKVGNPLTPIAAIEYMMKNIKGGP